MSMFHQYIFVFHVYASSVYLCISCQWHHQYIYINMCVCVCVFLYHNLSVWSSVHLFIHAFTSLSVCSTSHPYIPPSVNLSVCTLTAQLSVYSCIYLSICLSAWYIRSSVCQSVRPYIPSCVNLSVRLFICLSIHHPPSV